jgi:cytochrome P450
MSSNSRGASHDLRWDWDPRDEQIQHNQSAAYDDLRERCPVARSEALGWSLMRHDDVVEAVTDDATFSSSVSVHVAVPNGMDAPEHTAFRAVVDRSFTPDLVQAFTPTLQEIAADQLSAALRADGEIEVMSAIAEPFAARAQCAYLGWPRTVAQALQDWAHESATATRARDRAQLNKVAEQFDRIIVEMLDQQRAAGPHGPSTIVAQLLEEQIDGKPLSDSQLVSIVRNWTAGELGTIAAAVGIIIEFLARRPDMLEMLRTRPELHQAAMDEMLRLEAPLIANRRRTTRSVTMRGRTIEADAPVTVLWAAAQRDPRVFEDPAEFRLDRDPNDNLLYGRGPHYCPGEGLSRLELGVLLDELLLKAPAFTLAPHREPVRAVYPSGGFSEVRITLV